MSSILPWGILQITPTEYVPRFNWRWTGEDNFLCTTNPLRGKSIIRLLYISVVTGSTKNLKALLINRFVSHKKSSIIILKPSVYKNKN